ncbi:hypothetical protein COLO4_38054 [Corchorus olitorius]|uniref:Uncharacterized protein n=1 Tax=Corchorus olitorius TaxID=93759 RepID=A0A1R3FX80_9ROSI|nr:hypothetical protein COLO4_38054 [Corchorus olitorius]
MEPTVDRLDLNLSDESRCCSRQIRFKTRTFRRVPPRLVQILPMKDEEGEPGTNPREPRPRLTRTGTKVPPFWQLGPILPSFVCSAFSLTISHVNFFMEVLAVELALSSSWYPIDVAKRDPHDANYKVPCR